MIVSWLLSSGSIFIGGVCVCVCVYDGALVRMPAILWL
jgi:hypothetical protein